MLDLPKTPSTGETPQADTTGIAVPREGRGDMGSRPAATALGLAGLVLAAAACGSSQPPQPQSQPQPQPPPSLSLSSQPPSPTVTASVASEADDVEGQALAFVPMYYATLDKLKSDPYVSPGEVYNVSITPDAAITLKLLSEYRSAGDRQRGMTAVVSSRATAVDLTYKPKTNPAAYPSVQVRACVDVTNVRVSDMAGKRVGPASRPDFYVEQLTITNPKYPSTTGWKVSNTTNRAVSSCAG